MNKPVGRIQAPTKVKDLELLPQRSASQVKNGWAELKREVQKSGGVAITSHERVEMVVMDVAAYEELTRLSAEQQRSDAATLQQLSADFDLRLSKLKGAETRDRVEQVMRARGKARKRPIAGPSY